ncbi:hypothetical protein OROMI_013660 [Orobanche minor]
MDRGKLVVERVRGKSTLTRCFSKYPFKFISPSKVGPSQTDAVWIYTITYGGGIVSGDSIAFDVTVGDGCTAVLTTQSSTKVYKSTGSKCSEQMLEASIGRDALLVVIPDPVTCFSTAKYSQVQIFKVVPESSLLVVDWITSGRHERGEKWAFSHYKTTNRILVQDNEPIFLDTMPKMKLIQNQIQEDVKKLMSQQLRFSSIDSDCLSKPSFLASCSMFGPKEIGGVVVRVASMTTESVYDFLRHQLASMGPLLGASPYS